MTSLTMADEILSRFQGKRGQEPTPHPSREKGTKLVPLAEMFGPTIEGEGMVIGHQTYFLRFAGCDYKCKMCDSMHVVEASQFRDKAHYLTGRQIGEALKQYQASNNIGIKKCVLTGGNPCMWNLTGLLEEIPWMEWYLETQGTIIPEWLSKMSHITVSPKGPGFGEKFEQDKFKAFVDACYESAKYRFEQHQQPTSMNVKIVLFNTSDLDFAEYIVGFLSRTNIPVYLSIGNFDTPERLKEMNLVESKDMAAGLLNQYRNMLEEVFQRPRLGKCAILPQMHVLLWGNKQEV